MPNVCLYFELHQPYRLGDFSLFEMGKDVPYFGDENHDVNQIVFQKVSRKSYLPMLLLLLQLVRDVPTFSFALSCSGVFLEQAAQYQPEVIVLLQQLAQTGRVEFLAETYYHSLASLYDDDEFASQVKKHSRLVKKLFQVKPTTFRNTELVYANSIAPLVAKFGFVGMLTEAVPRYLHNRAFTKVFRSQDGSALPLLLKHSQLSDDVAFRFSDRNWSGFPLTAAQYVAWLEAYSAEEFVNLFMDFETFGEHQWAETGIFDFFAEFVTQFSQRPGNHFVTPRQVFASQDITSRSALPGYDVPEPISWADVNRDLTAWLENAFQQDCLRQLYALREPILATRNRQLIDTWRKLQTSDHFYYMCTKWSADGDVHAYFSPYETPYEAYRQYSLVLADLDGRLRSPAHS